MMTCLFASGIFSLCTSIKGNNYVSFVFLIAFLFAFETSGGPVSWLYIAEIMKDRGSAFATFINWVTNLIIGAVTPYAVAYLTNFGEDNSQVGWIFIGCGFFTVFASLFMYFFMIETFGLDFEEIARKFEQAGGKNKKAKIPTDDKLIERV